MNLAELLAGHADAGEVSDIVVHGLALDSREVRAGDAFVALKGSRQHGITFAPMALARGAAAILAERPGEVATPAPAVLKATAEGRLDLTSPASREKVPKGRMRASVAETHANPESSTSQEKVPEGRMRASVAAPASSSTPTVWIDNLRDKLGSIASRFFGDPSLALTVIGVTGTNGKTSTVHLLAQALHHAGHRVATVGTLGAGLVGEIVEGARTTPDAISVQGLLATFRDDGASHVAMEVSSHALDQGRVNAVAFDLAVFTNLTRDHLDYHGTMHAYGMAKERLFAWPGLDAAVINVDDPFGRALAARVHGDITLLRYGVDREDADLVARSIEPGVAGLRFHLTTPWGEGDVVTRLLGRFNVSNLLAVAACLGHLGFAFDAIRDGLAILEPVSGRMNRIGGEGALPLVVVDYAHTPDALEQALTSLRAHTHERLICVFGCGGERDAGKRPQMGAIAEALADRIIVTDDNPRGENGDAIVEQIVAGLAHPQNATIERNRGAAIALAIREARAGDVVLIAGKGHEPYQEVDGVRYPFDDLTVAREVLGASA
ncbi:MAG TPA: UDP-N-acetylmuramoyl-L-alanyl-D-glutamate--2,6-diaminopimelate ligase [Rhodanobacteraceae bacterium]|nr:UDP-N-acetylmuramoyl-L-alanyl-D-glutamate--2,6-diaminopimelate ligase [Rhodanobacteraceae bacterium]